MTEGIKSERYKVPDCIGTLVSSEWDVIKRFQQYIFGEWDTIAKDRVGGSIFLPDSCCGIYFYSKVAMATNSHWVVMIDCPDATWPDGHHSLFYNYITDDIRVNYNPYEEAGYDIRDMQRPFFHWQPHVVKVRVEDLSSMLDRHHNNVKEKRKVSARFAVDSFEKCLWMRLEHRDGATELEQIPLWLSSIRGAPKLEHGVEFAVNSAYLYKMMEIVKEWYHVIDICFDGQFSHPVLVKAYNPRAPRKIQKPRIMFAIGQYYFT